MSEIFNVYYDKSCHLEGVRAKHLPQPSTEVLFSRGGGLPTWPLRGDCLVRLCLKTDEPKPRTSKEPLKPD
uniref:Uncharacterized protein n=1 Tax=Candidatus Kentrum sp. FW TaxID=2126338 RepID=A0A450RVQ0_9GAMM|nr:MAG: hypothetical protein BECKFW1821A_GA0114235_100357 [Candidatus Kentron sp. FW]